MKSWTFPKDKTIKNIQYAEGWSKNDCIYISSPCECTKATHWVRLMDIHLIGHAIVDLYVANPTAGHYETPQNFNLAYNILCSVHEWRNVWPVLRAANNSRYYKANVSAKIWQIPLDDDLPGSGLINWSSRNISLQITKSLWQGEHAYPAGRQRAVCHVVHLTSPRGLFPSSHWSAKVARDVGKPRDRSTKNGHVSRQGGWIGWQSVVTGTYFT